MQQYERVGDSAKGRGAKSGVFGWERSHRPIAAGELSRLELHGITLREDFSLIVDSSHAS